MSKERNPVPAALKAGLLQPILSPSSAVKNSPSAPAAEVALTKLGLVVLMFNPVAPPSTIELDNSTVPPLKLPKLPLGLPQIMEL